MHIQNIVTTQHPGKHKIPRYIYHLTPQTAYESMLKDGVIKPAQDEFFGEGIFTFELENLFKCWQKSNSWTFENLIERLLDYVSHGKPICLLKIPTKNLCIDNLVIRSQNRLFGWSRTCDKKTSQQIDNFSMQLIKKGNSIEGSQMLALEKFLPNIADHIEFGVPAVLSTLYKQRKEAIEYIYSDDIPITDVKKIGEINIAEFRQTSDFDITHPIKSIFTKLLHGTQEEKAVKQLDC